MTSIVIPFKLGNWGETELMFALRSVEKHLHNYGELFIIGDKPKTLTNYIHIPFVDDTRRVYKEKNIFLKVMVACNDERVTDCFFLMNDDHFLLSDYEADKFPAYYGEWPNKTDMYKATMVNTKKALAQLFSSPDDEFLFYDVHSPILISKECFINYMKRIDWDVKAGYCMKSIYANIFYFDQEATYYSDLKIRTQERPYDFMNIIKDRLWFSTDDSARSYEMEGLLKCLYPVKSKWEL